MALMDIDAVDWWSFDLVREALVEAAVLWRRSPGDGRWPFASDGPWHLMSRDVQAGDYDARGGFDTSSDVAVRPMPLSRAEVEQRNRVSEWVLMVPAPDDRRLLALCLEFHSRGYTQLPWGRIMGRMGVRRGKDGLQKRYRAALRAIAEALNTAEIRKGNVSRGGM
jgi:hypothetical protein